MSGQADRREHPRFIGPFDVERTGGIRTHAHDLSFGGCFVNSFEEPEAGRRVTLRMLLPREGWLTLTGETLHTCPGFGFAVRFVDLAPDVVSRLAAALEILAAKQANVPVSTSPDHLRRVTGMPLEAVS
jgi:hypothetical protein